jgi:hypothetical protein
MVALSVELCGRQKELGFLLGLLVQTVNGVYGLITGDIGWVISWVVTGPVFMRWYLKWKKGKRASQAGDQPTKAKAQLRISVHSTLPKLPGGSDASDV